MRRGVTLAAAILAFACASSTPAVAADSLWTQAQDLSAEQNDGEAPQVAIADDGSAVAVWLINDSNPAVNKKRVQFAARERGENFVVPGPRQPGESEADHIARVEPTYLSGTAVAATPHIRIKMNKDGDAIVVWQADDGSIRSSYKPAGGDFGDEQVVTAGNAAEPEAGIDGQGAATVIYRGTGSRGNSVYKSESRPAGAAAVWGDQMTLIGHPFGFGTPEIPTSYTEIHGSLAVDEAGNRSAVFASDADPDAVPGDPTAHRIYEVLRGAGDPAWTVENKEDPSGQPDHHSTHALIRGGEHLAGWARAGVLHAVSSPGNPTGVGDSPSDPIAGPTTTSGSTFSLDGSGLALWSTGSLLHASYVQNSINFDPEPDTDPVAGNAGAIRTRPRFAEDDAGSILTVFKQRRGSEESIQVALRPPAGGTKFDEPVAVRGADGAERSGAPVALSEPCDVAGAVNCDLEPDAGKVDPGPTIAMNSDGEGVAAWSQGDGSGNLVVKVSLFIPRPDPGPGPGTGVPDIPEPPPPPARPKPAVPSLIELARPLGRGQATVLTLKAGEPGSKSTSDGADKLDWGFGTPNEPPVAGEVVGGQLERSVRLRLPDRSFTATVQARTPEGLRTFTRTFTAPSPPDTGDAGKVLDGLKKVAAPPVFAVGATNTLTTVSKTCSQMKVWSGEQKTSGCFKPIENLVDVPSLERGALHEVAKELKLDETKKEVMQKATELTDGYVAEGRTLLNDEFPVIPSGAADVVSFPQAKTLVSAKATLPVGSASYDPKNGFNLKVDPKKIKIPLGKLPKPPKLPSLGGLEVVGDWDVDLDKKEAKIRASIVFPKEITKAGIKLENQIVLRATADRVIVDSARIGPIDADIGALKVTAFKIEYQREGDEWLGQAKACIIKASCFDMSPPNGSIRVKGGRVVFAGASLFFPPPGIPLFTGVDLTKVGFGIGFDPTRIIGSAQIKALQLVAIEGRLVLAFPTSGKPFILRREEVGPDFPAGLYGKSFTGPTVGVTGAAAISIPEVGDIEVAKGHVLYEYPGYVAFGAGFDIDLVKVVQLRGGLSGEFDLDREIFNVHGDIEACVFDVACGGAVANISRGQNRAGGAGACISLLGVSVGGGVQWRRLDDPFIWPFDGCKWSRFKIDVRASKAQTAAGDFVLNVRKGEPSPAIKLYGQGGAPTVVVRGPDGQVLNSDSPKNIDVSAGGKIRIMRFGGNQYAGPFTVVGLQDAKPGRYTINTLPGSVPVTKTAQATDQPDAKVSGKVTGKDRRRVLTYDVRGREGQRVSFEEVAANGATKTIGSTTRGGKGRLRFDSAPGRGRRRVFAQFELSGVPAERKLVTSFNPASPRLRKVKGVRVRRKGSLLLVSWRKVAGATSYEVGARLSGRRMTFARTSKRGVRFKVPKWFAGRLTVRAIDDLRQSPVSGAARFKAISAEPSPFRSLEQCKVGKTSIRCLPPKRYCAGRRATIVSEPGRRTVGTGKADVIVGTPGADVIDGRGGNDLICGGGGDDTIKGGSGNDRIRGGAGGDTLSGGRGNDRIRGGPGDDVIRGDIGNDRLRGDSGNDSITGDSGRDKLSSGPDRDILAGGPGNDRLNGGKGKDRLSGGKGKDRLRDGSRRPARVSGR